MAAYSHAQFSNEVEHSLIQFYIEKMKWPNSAAGHFTSGGSEANFTAVLCALAHHFPEYLTEGLAGIKENQDFTSPHWLIIPSTRLQKTQALVHHLFIKFL